MGASFPEDGPSCLDGDLEEDPATQGEDLAAFVAANAEDELANRLSTEEKIMIMQNFGFSKWYLLLDLGILLRILTVEMVQLLV